jgi:LysM repeat protein
MSSEQTSTKICPTCGTRLSASATKCTVCGSTLTQTTVTAKTVQAARMPEVTLSLPVMLGLIILLLAIGAGVVYAVLQATLPKGQISSLPSATVTVTPTTTLTPTITYTPTLESTATPLPTIEYKIATGDLCNSIAYNFHVSLQSILLLNKMSQDSCNSLVVGQSLFIPQPTVTPPPTATNTPNPTDQAKAGCEKVDVIITENDSLSGIALKYGITVQALKDYNGLASDVIFSGQKISVPLCNRGPQDTVTPTPVPPYAPPNLLLPADGATFMNANDAITLQWASVGDLRQNEAYAVTITDTTDSNQSKFVDYVNDTKYIVPDTIRPTDGKIHIFRWSVLTVRQTGTNKDSGKPTWEPGGPVSAERVFGWSSGSGAAPTAKP